MTHGRPTGPSGPHEAEIRPAHARADARKLLSLASRKTSFSRVRRLLGLEPSRSETQLGIDELPRAGPETERR